MKSSLNDLVAVLGLALLVAMLVAVEASLPSQAETARNVASILAK